jgi:hypothetical protein
MRRKAFVTSCRGSKTTASSTSSIADDVRLDQVNKSRMNGKAEVSKYFGNYSKVHDWLLKPGLVEGRPAILVFDPGGLQPKYFMLLRWDGDKVATIRDFRHASYVADGAEFLVAPAARRQGPLATDVRWSG